MYDVEMANNEKVSTIGCITSMLKQEGTRGLIKLLSHITPHTNVKLKRYLHQQLRYSISAVVMGQESSQHLNLMYQELPHSKLETEAEE